MPAFIGGVATRYAETSFVDVSGQTLIVIEEDLPLTATDAQIAAYQDAAGNLSNAAIFRQVAGSAVESALEDVTAFDEAESSVNKGANMIFQSVVNLENRSFRVPAIDLDAVEHTGRFLKPRSRNAQVHAAVIAILAILGVDWIYIGSTISTQSSQGASTADEIYIPEPEPEPEESGDMELFELPFTFADTPELLLVSVPALATITSVRLHIDIPFDVPTSITVGDVDVPDRLMTTLENNPLEIGAYEVEPDYEYPAVTTLVLYIASGAASGAGHILIEFDKE